MIIMKKIALAASFACVAGSVVAQVVLPPSADPGALQQRRLEEERRRLELERLERQPIADPIRQELPPPAAAPSAAAAVRFMVREIRFAPTSEIFSAQELQALAQPLTGKEVDLTDLQALAEKINATYRERGVVTARAVIPAQDVTEGIFTIRLVEGRLGKVTVSGNASTRESYVLGRVKAEPERIVDLPALQSSLVQFNRVNDAQLRADLKPGQSFGLTDLEISVAEPPKHVFRAGLDNHGSEVTGENRLGLSYTNNSVLGWRDTFTLGLMTASGLKSVSLDYGIPVNQMGGRLNLTVNRDNTSIKYGPFASLDITGTSTATSLSLRQPVHFGARSQTSLLGALRQRDVQNDIADIFLSGTKTDDVQLGVEHQQAGDASQWVASYSLFSGRAASAGERTSFSVGRGSFRHTYFWEGGWALRSTVSFQHSSSDELPSGDYLFLGGEGSVRGYPVGAFSGDQGVLASAELHHPITGAQGNADDFSASGFFFVDTGRVEQVLPSDSILDKSKTLTSVGWGANLSMGRHLSAKVALAYAVNKLPDEDKRVSVRFQLSSQF